jgi:alkyl sulfatase BDS1-like metallo-beta-lactamase superfamily hydrolase
MSNNEQPKTASVHTKAKNSTVIPPSDAGDFDRARRGFIASLPTGRITDAAGRMVTDVNRYDFLRAGGPSPETVNPSLWRHAQLNAHHGLFEVADGVWQVRGYDLSNITFIKGTEGWVVIDPLTTEATARASYELITAQLGHRPITAVIYTHSHADHFGGVLGVTSQAEVDAGKCRVIAPVGFLHETVGENVIAGPAMGRRSAYQFGPQLPAGPTGHVDCGLGNSVPLGPPGLIAPTEDITFTGEELVVDGVRIIFQLTPETEAPAEMNFFFPDQGWLCMAENCSHTMHNLVPIRGAQVRNSLMWSKYIDESIELFAADTKILFTSHNWPRWGNEDLHEFLIQQRDLYKWIHDQTMRLANQGFTPLEIAATLVLPDEFKVNDHTSGYYGDLVHNSKAVYQRYLSWYDGNPANLNKLPPTEVGKRYVELAGGADALIANARKAFDKGDYRWVTELVNHLVFADPTNTAARNLQADALEQLGYQAESSTFRNAYLMGAQELRQGPPTPTPMPVRNRGLLFALTIEQLFDSLSVRVKSEELGGVSLCVNWHFTDIDEKWILGISNRTLYATPGRHEKSAAATITLTRLTMLDVVTQTTTFVDQITAGTITIDGDASALLQIFGKLDTITTGFAIVEP